MKKTIPMLAFVGFALTSCVIQSTHITTGNPIGTKIGYVKSKIVGNFDVGLAAAAKQGKITKIGSVDVKYYSNGKLSVLVTGE